MFLFNYIKFRILQIFGFISSIPQLNKFRKNPDKYTLDEKFAFLKKIAAKSLKKVKINVNVIGREKIPKEPVLFVINHSSMLDSYILVNSVDRGIGCVIADEPVWRKIPIASKWIELVKCVFINRKNNREGMKAINQAADNIKNNHSMAIFPEGDLTWVKDDNAYISDFRSGALKIAYKAKCPIVPMVIKNSKGTYEGYQPVGKINSKDVEVEFLDPVYKHIENPRYKTVELGEEIRESMIEKMREFDNAKCERAAV